MQFKSLNLFLLAVNICMLRSCSAQSRIVENEVQTVTTENLKYYLYYPVEYENQKEQTFGLLLFLHGGGEAGGELEQVRENVPPKLLAEGKQFPFLVLAPQNPRKKKWWNTRAIIKLLDSVTMDNRVDPKRIYLTGLSRGGSAVWELATQYPNKFVALAVVCGMAPLPYAHWINKKLPIWVFHGNLDRVVSVEEPDRMVAKLKQMKYNIKYIRYKGVGHSSWHRAYVNDSLYEWFNEQKRD